MTNERSKKEHDSDFPGFAAALEKAISRKPGDAWNVLVVSEMEALHEVSKSVLGDLKLAGRTISTKHTTNARSAKEFIKTNQDTAVVLVGSSIGQVDTLEFIRYVRDAVTNPLVRIIVLMSEGGQVPESSVVLKLDVSFERDQTVSSPDRFLTKVASALKTYQDLITMESYSEDLQRMNAWLRTMLSSVGDGVITTDINGNIKLMNPVASQMAGTSSADAKGHPLKSVFSFKDEQTGDLLEIDWNAEAGKKTATSALLITRNYRQCHVSFTMSPIVSGGDYIHGYIFVIRDMTEHVNLEHRLRQQQKLESLGTLTSGIAHEIKNPLTVIMNTAETLCKRFENDKETSAFTNKIVEETQRVSKIATNMLAFARQDVFEDAMVAAGMEEIVESVLSLVQAVVAKEDIEFQVEIPDDLPNVKCRMQQVQQVLINLITNARDALNQRYTSASQKKIIKIKCSLQVDAGGKWVRTTIEDRATGIKASIVDRIFDPFFTTKQSGTGTGLGLSVSHNIIAKHGGRLTVESEVLDYTRFHMDLLPAVKTPSII